MFKQVMAIDVAGRVPDFSIKIKPFVSEKTITINTSEDTPLSERNLSSVDAILVSIYQPLPESLLSKMPNLRVIVVLGTSTKKIALEYCLRHKISVANITDYCDDETAEWVMMHILKHFREAALPLSVNHKKLGLVGVGSVGKKLIKLAQAFDMEIFYNAQTSHEELDKLNIKKISKEEMFASCDVVSVHTPPFLAWLTKPTLLLAKPGLLLLNTCMGRISHDNDLENALASRHDITLVMDAIAGTNYPNLKNRAHIFNQPAFSTVDSRQRLIDKFFAHIKNAAF